MFGIAGTMRATVAAVVAAALITLAGALWWSHRANARLRVDNARLERSLVALTMQAEQSALARDVERARAKASAARNEALTAEIETILTGGIPDATLHPDLADIFNGRNVHPD